MSELNIDEIRREWSEFSRRVESATSVSTEMLRRAMRSDSRVLRRYGWINIIGGAVIIPFVLWYVAHHYGFGAFFWLFAAGLAVAFVQGQKEAGKHGEYHNQRGGAGGDAPPDQQKKRNANKKRTAKTDQLSFRQSQYHLGFHTG